MLKATVNRAALKDAVAIAKRHVPRHAILPALAGIQVEGYGDHLELTATDLDTFVRVTVPANVPDAGAVLLDARQLAAAVMSGTDMVTIAEDAERVTVDSGGTAALRPMLVEDFPPPMPPAGGDPVYWTSADVGRLARAAHAAGTDDGRPVLTAVFFDQGYAVATDSYRLAWTGLEVGPLAGALVPGHTVREVARWKTAARHVSAFGTPGAVTFAGQHTAGTKRAPRVTDIVLTVRTIEGQYPNWRALVPGACEAVYSFDTAELADAASAAKRFASKRPNVPVLLEDVDGAPYILKVSDQEAGDWSATVSARRETGDPVSIAFNPTYLADAVTAAAGDAERVTVAMRDGLKPAVFGEPDGDVRVLLMPMRVF